MENKFWNKTNILGLAGLLAYVVTVLVLFIPFKGEPSMSLVNWHSPIGLIVIALFFLSLGLYVYGIFKKPQQQLKLSGLATLVETRKLYLTPLKDNIKDRLSRANYLVKEASEYPLNEYSKKYAPTKKAPQIGVYSWIFVKLRFIVDNLYFESLKGNDAEYRKLNQEYQFLYTQITDGKLKKLLNGLWSMEHTHNSLNVFTLLSKNNPTVAIKVTPRGLRTARIGEKFGIVAFNRQLDIVMKRIETLLDGVEDE